MRAEDAAAAVSAETGIGEDTVRRVLKAFWRAVREHVRSLPLKEGLTEDDLMRLRPNVSVQGMGKLSVTPGRYVRVREKYERLNKSDNDTHNEGKAHVHLHSDHRRQV